MVVFSRLQFSILRYFYTKETTRSFNARATHFEVYDVSSVFISFSFAGKVVPFLEYAVSVASVLTILAITIDRYYAICHPLKAQYTCTFERMLKTVCIVWTIAAIASSPLVAIAQFRDSRFVDGTPIKVCRQPIRTHPAKAYVISVVVIFFFIPFMVVTLFYSFISRRFTDDKNAVGMNNGMGMTQQRYAARRQVTTMLFTMVFVFFLCLIPGRAIVLWMTFATPSQLVNIGFEGYLCLTYFPRVLHFTNSAVNPIIYSLISTKFSLAFRRIFSSGNRDLQRLRRNWISWRRSPFTDDSFKLFVCNSLKCKTSHV